MFSRGDKIILLHPSQSVHIKCVIYPTLSCLVVLFSLVMLILFHDAVKLLSLSDTDISV